ncbi:MAG: glycerol kinase GlpK [Proteobacteria bacterium]|nr:glycerol kinase GlpK [Pseudomonadota bacterium]
MARCVVAIDQGTTATTVLVVDEALRVRARATEELPQLFPRPGWVEHDPRAIWETVEAALARALPAAGCAAHEIAAVGVTNQRETTLLWERASGRPLHHAIVWQDRRTTERCAALRATGLEPLYRQRTGLVLDPYFSGTKLAWLLDHCDPQRTRARRGELAFGTVDSYLLWQLTGGAVHVTDPSNASRTLLFGLEHLRWEPELLAPLDIPEAVLPTVRSSSEVYGLTRGVRALPDGIPIAGLAGDQQAALFGQACFAPGDAKCTYGTGAFLLVNTGSRPLPSQHGLLTTVAWRLGEQVSYALEGSAFIAGAAVQWLRDGLGLIDEAGAIEALARRVPDSGGVVFVPALVGLGAPYWRPEARGLISGLTRGTTAAHLARATLEGIACQICELAEAMAGDLGAELGSFRVDGGAARNDLLMQLQADLLGHALVRPAITETTALGAALLAGLATGVWPDQAAIGAAWQAERTFEPQLAAAQRTERLAEWRRAVARA